MAKTAICTFITNQSLNKGGKSKPTLSAVLYVYPNSGGDARRYTICKTQTVKLNYGDRIECVSGNVVVLINPGTQAGAFILRPDLPSCVNWNERTELEINDETTKHIHRGKVSVGRDIGNVSRIAGASSETWWQK
jgi:hypothetical protein